MHFVKKHWLSLLGIMLVMALGVQTVLGERGLQARSALKLQIAGLDKKLTLLRERRQKLEQETKHLSPDRVHPELLELYARELLGFVHENEQVKIQKTH